MRNQRGRIIVGALSLCLSLAQFGQAADFVIDSGKSHVEVMVHATGDDFVAQLSKFESAIEVDARTGHPLAGKFAWDFKDLDTRNSGRNKEMLHWLEYQKCPRAVFTFKRCIEENGELKAEGELKMHEQTHLLTVPLKIVQEGEELIWRGKFVLDHREYGLPKIVKLLLLRVDPLLSVTIDLHGKISP